MPVPFWQKCLILLLALPGAGGCLSPGPLNHTRQEIVYEQGKLQKFAYVGDTYTSPERPYQRSPFLEAIDILKSCDPEALPRLEDLPRPPSRQLPDRKYVGIVQNLTSYDISIPSSNSGAVLVVPAKGWLEYEAWDARIKLEGFVNGRQVYAQTLQAKPRRYEYFGKYYDFVATIRPEPCAPLLELRSPKRQQKRKASVRKS